jgi:hypothetical protein
MTDIELKTKSRSVAILVTRQGMGEAEAPLQQKLLGTYLTMLHANELYPGAICFYADGVKMVVEGSPALDILQELERREVRIIICQTCLKYFGLEDKVKVGIVGGMNDIILAQYMADKVITL